MASLVLAGRATNRVCRGSLGFHHWPSAGPQLHEITSAPLSAAHRNASASRTDPRPDARRIGISLANGATPDAPSTPLAQATPAQAVPWLSPSSRLGTVSVGRGLLVWRVASRGATTLPAPPNSG